MNQLAKVQNPKIHHIPQSLKIFPWFSMVFPWFSPGFPMAFPHRGAAATVSSTPGGSAPLSPDRGTAPADHRWIRGTRGTPWGSMG